MTASQTARDVQAREGWTDGTLLDVLLDYLDGQGSDVALGGYLAERSSGADADDDTAGAWLDRAIQHGIGADESAGCTCCQTHSYPGMADRYPGGECGRCGHLYRKHTG